MTASSPTRSLNRNNPAKKLAFSLSTTLQSAPQSPLINTHNDAPTKTQSLPRLDTLSMDHPSIEELQYNSDSRPLFAALLDMESPIFLDSAKPFSTRGRYDIIAAAPICTVKSETHRTKQKTKKTPNTYFDELRDALNEYVPTITNDYHLPFVGGALGYLGYDLGHQIEPIAPLIPSTLDLPDAIMGVYSWAVVVDHRQQRSLLVAHPHARPSDLKDVRSRLASASKTMTKPTDFRLQSPFEPSISYAEYQAAFNQIQDYILSGDCYQINLAQQFSAHFQGEPWAAYRQMREAAAAPFSAFMQFQDTTILSMSPERFLHVNNQKRVTTSPIKGTIGRGHTPAADNEMAQKLLNSGKDRAENLMIVDLLRNDLGKTCVPGSIQVDELFELQTFETVHHLVSTVSGQLAPRKDSIALLASCFPGGSITGTPKVRAMEIIEELESTARGVYCGAIGYISCDGQMDLNIAIRTMVCENKEIHCWAGGGIVADSQCEAEYQECLTKVEKLMAALPTA